MRPYTAFIMLSVIMVMFVVSDTNGLKCRSNDDQKKDDFTEAAAKCLYNVSNWDKRTMNNNTTTNNNNNGRKIFNDKRNDDRISYGSKNSFNPDNMSNRDNQNNMYNRNNRDYNRNNNNNNNNNNNGYGSSWRRQQATGGYGSMDDYSDSPHDSYYDNQRSNHNERGYRDKNTQKRNNTNSKNNNSNKNDNASSMDSSMESSMNSPLEKVEPCIVHCIFREMHMLDESGMPDRALVTKIMIQRLHDSKVIDFVEESIEDCFEILDNDDKRNSCDYTKNLALCLEEKGKRNCEDWEDGSHTSNSRNSKNSKRQN